MRKIIVCDDEAYMREQLIGYLLRAEPILHEQFSVIQCASGEELLTLVADADIVLLDIQMGDLSGMDAAHILREKNKNVCLIFVTSMLEYALEGYSVHAFGFLKKPVNFGTFLQQMEDAVQAIDIRRGKQIALKKGAHIHRYNCNDIYCFEVQGHSVIVSLDKQDIEYYINLDDIESMIPQRSFFRCHKSYLVNLRHISRILPNDLLLNNGKSVPLSKRRKKDFMEAFSAYMEGLP